MIALRGLFAPTLLCLMTCVLPTAAGPPACADDGHAAPQASPPDVWPDAMLPMEPEPALCAPCDRDFWIVSTWECPQKGTHGCVGCPLGYFRCEDPCGHPCRRDRQTFEQWLRPGVPLCVVIHGSYTRWDQLCSETERAYQWLRAAAGPLPVQFVFFSWPAGSLTPIPNPDPNTLGCRATFNGLYLAQWLPTLPFDTPVSLLGFSHGSRMIAATLHLAAGGEVKGYQCCAASLAGRRVRALLITAAIDRHWLMPGERYGQALCSVESAVYLRNRRDWVLTAYPMRRPFSHRALGQAGLKPEHQAALGAKLFEWDVTSQIGRGHLWDNYVRRPDVAAMMIPYLAFADAPPAVDPHLAPYPAASAP